MSEKEQNEEATESSRTSLDDLSHSNVLPPWDKRYYSHSYWTILKKRVAFQTPFFGLQIDKDDFESFWFSKFDPDKNDLNYIDAISLDTDSRKIINNLDKVDFHLEIHTQENTYRAKRANSIPRITSAVGPKRQFMVLGFAASQFATCWFVSETKFLE